MPSPVMSFEDFVERLRKDVPATIRADNERVEGELPEIFELKPQGRQRSLLINPADAREHLKDLMARREKVDTFLDVVSSVRGEKVEITEVSRGHREDERDFILKGRNPNTGVNVMDMRVLLGQPERAGDDIRNEVTQAALYKALNLHVYREKAHLN
jgi:hypothetical protein